MKKIRIKRKEKIDEGLGRAFGMGSVAAGACELTSRYGPGAALPPGVGAALGAAWYVLSGEAKKDYNHTPQDDLQAPKPKESQTNPNVMAVAEALNKTRYAGHNYYGSPAKTVLARKSPSSSGGNGDE